MVTEFPYLYGADLSWLVGILEGEGSFGASTNDDKYFHVWLSVSMTDKDILNKVSKLVGLGKIMGPYIRANKSWKPVWVWRLSGLSAYKVMKLVLPLMGYRRARKIEELLSIYECNRELGKLGFQKGHEESKRRKRSPEWAAKMAEYRRIARKKRQHELEIIS